MLQMWGMVVWRSTAVLLALALTHFLSEAAVIRVSVRPDHKATLLCAYPYEDHSVLSQLSVLWRSPDNQLLCHYIKHKDFQTCSEGYNMTYSPGVITLIIERARPQDFGSHVCSVNKRDEFMDYSVELVSASESPPSTTPNYNRQQNQSGSSWTLAAMLMLTLIHIWL